MAYANPWTGKPVDKISDLLPRPNGNTCDDCGSPCIDNCIMCGAPQCCPSCCYDASVDRNPEGEKPQALSAEHESAASKADAQPSTPEIEAEISRLQVGGL